MGLKIEAVSMWEWHVYVTKKRPTYVHMGDMRRVWAALSVDPDPNLAKLSESTFMNTQKVRACLEILDRSGYIEYHPLPSVKVIIPFVEEEKWEGKIESII